MNEFNFARYCQDPEVACCKAERRANELYAEAMRQMERAARAEAESAAKDARIAELEAERDRWEKVATGFRDMIGNPMPGQGERLQVLAAYEAAKEARG